MQTPMPQRSVLLARHTEAVRDWDPQEDCVRVIGSYACWRVTCRRHGAHGDFERRFQADGAARSPEHFCESCRKEWEAWERANPPRGLLDRAPDPIAADLAAELRSPYEPGTTVPKVRAA